MSTVDRLRDPVTVSRAVPVLRELQTSKEGRCHTRRRAAKTRPAHEGPGQRQAGGQHAEQQVGPTLHREVGGGGWSLQEDDVQREMQETAVLGHVASTADLGESRLDVESQPRGQRRPLPVCVHRAYSTSLQWTPSGGPPLGLNSKSPREGVWWSPQFHQVWPGVGTCICGRSRGSSQLPSPWAGRTPRRTPAAPPDAVGVWHLPELCLRGPGAAGHHGNGNFAPRFPSPSLCLSRPCAHSRAPLCVPSPVFAPRFLPRPPRRPPRLGLYSVMPGSVRRLRLLTWGGGGEHTSVFV